MLHFSVQRELEALLNFTLLIMFHRSFQYGSNLLCDISKVKQSYMQGG
jgi:hypothetical protein